MEPETEYSEESGGEILTAEALKARLPWKALERRFHKACRDLLAVLDEVKAVQSEANLYLEEDHLHLMSGASHDFHRERPQQQRIMATHFLPGSDGGAW